VPQGYAEEQPSEPAGFYCSTSGTYFPDKESLQEHYRSDFHRYNLKVGGLRHTLPARSIPPRRPPAT